MGRRRPFDAYLSTQSFKATMVQRTKTVREQILSTLAEGPMTSKEMGRKIKCHNETLKLNRYQLLSDGLIAEVGERPLRNGFGKEKIWALVTVKPKAVNAFDWRN